MMCITWRCQCVSNMKYYVCLGGTQRYDVCFCKNSDRAMCFLQNFWQSDVSAFSGKGHLCPGHLSTALTCRWYPLCSVLAKAEADFEEHFAIFWNTWLLAKISKFILEHADILHDELDLVGFKQKMIQCHLETCWKFGKAEYVLDQQQRAQTFQLTNKRVSEALNHLETMRVSLRNQGSENS